MEQNKRFAERCLNRVKMISNEIVTEQELSTKEAAEAEAKQTDAGNTGDTNDDTNASADAAA